LQKQFLNLASDLVQQPNSNSKIVEKVTTEKILVAPYGKLLLHYLTLFLFAPFCTFSYPRLSPTATGAGP